jgi:hypothetical protein
MKSSLTTFTCPAVAAAFTFALAAGLAAPAHAGNGADPSGLIAAVFLGGTDGPYGTDFTVGAEAEYRWKGPVGIGAIVEHIPEAGAYGDYDVTIALGAVHLHPYKGFRLTAGAGSKFAKGDEHFVTRLGLAYEFTMDQWVVAPLGAVDFVEGTEYWVFGTAFGYHFTW